MEGGSTAHLNYRFAIIFNRGSRLNRSSSSKIPGDNYKWHQLRAGQRALPSSPTPCSWTPLALQGWNRPWLHPKAEGEMVSGPLAPPLPPSPALEAALIWSPSSPRWPVTEAGFSLKVSEGLSPPSPTTWIQLSPASQDLTPALKPISWIWAAESWCCRAARSPCCTPHSLEHPTSSKLSTPAHRTSSYLHKTLWINGDTPLVQKRNPRLSYQSDLPTVT